MQRTPGAVLLALLALLVAASATATADSAAAAAAALEPAADLSGDWAQPATSADLADDYEYHYDDMVAAQAVGSEPAPPLNPPTPPPPVTGASHVPPAEAADAEWLAALESSRAADEALRRDLDGWQVSYEYAEEASGVAGLGSGISPKSSVSTPAAAAGMLAELTSDIAELAAAVEAAASVGGAGANGSAAEVVEGLPPVSVPTLKIELPSGWSAELMYSRNESSYGVSSRRAWWLVVAAADGARPPAHWQPAASDLLRPGRGPHAAAFVGRLGCQLHCISAVEEPRPSA